MRRSLLVELAYGFGDAVFGLRLLEKLSEQNGGPIGVATMPHVVDAFQNVPFIDEIIPIGGLNEGHKASKQFKYRDYKQVTSNVYFQEFKNNDPEHSLIDTPKLIGRKFGVEVTDQRPVIYLTDEELHGMRAKYNDGIRSIAIESHYKSGQSWASASDFQKIVDKFAKTHRIMMLSPETPLPTLPSGAVGFDDMKRWTRRQCLGALTTCQYFFNVGSGFFCASLAFGTFDNSLDPISDWPPFSFSLWKDEYYKYKKRLKEIDTKPVEWLDNTEQLTDALNSISIS